MGTVVEMRLTAILAVLALVASPVLCGSDIPPGMIRGLMPEGSDGPHSYACRDTESQKLPFCDTKLSLNERVADLVSRLTAQEKLGLIGADGTDGQDTCPLVDSGVKRLGIPTHMWLVETNSGVAAACYNEKCPTIFPTSLLLGGSFNRTLWHAKGDVVSTELRAFNNMNWHRFSDEKLGYYIGLSGYGPNINIARDPRFGRTGELVSEDPFLSGEYAAQYVRGCQEGSDPRYLKMIAQLKHYTAYSVEAGRASFNGKISIRDFWDTYMPQFKRGFVEGRASGSMCSYAQVNGVPSCANDYILNKAVRDLWGVKDAIHTSDCGAVNNMVDDHYAKDKADAAAKSLNNGMDLNTEDLFSNGPLGEAILRGDSDMAHLDQAVTRVLKMRMRTGMFDPVEDQPYTKLGPEHIATDFAIQQTYEAAAQGMVLLKNEDGALPLKTGKTIAVVGPHATSQEDLAGNYYADAVCPGPQVDGNYNFKCITTIGDAITKANKGGKTLVTRGVDVNTDDKSDIDNALKYVSQADVVVLAVGINKTLEQEGLDRTDTALPGLQPEFCAKVVAAAKARNIPVVVVMINAGALAIDDLVSGESAVPAIVEAFTPVTQTGAIIDGLFGKHNKFGRLTYTMYPHSFIKEIEMADMSITKGPGRGYRYYTGKPLFPFGHGLSYTTFTHSCSVIHGDTSPRGSIVIGCEVENTGSLSGDNVLMVYHSASDDIRSKVDHPVPVRSLVEFERITVDAGKKQQLHFVVPTERLALTDNNGSYQVYKGEHSLIIDNGQGKSVTVNVSVDKQITTFVAPPFPEDEN